MTLEQFKSKAEVRNFKSKSTQHSGKIYSYEGLEYYEIVVSGMGNYNTIEESYVSLGEVIPYEIFKELLGELD